MLNSSQNSSAFFWFLSSQKLYFFRQHFIWDDFWQLWIKKCPLRHVFRNFFLNLREKKLKNWQNMVCPNISCKMISSWHKNQ